MSRGVVGGVYIGTSSMEDTLVISTQISKIQSFVHFYDLILPISLHMCKFI